MKPPAAAVKIAIALATLGAFALLAWGGIGRDLSGISGRSALLPFLSTLVVASLGMRLFLWLIYRPRRPAPGEGGALPTLTVIIPAFNEGVRVRRSIESVLASAYPPERLRVIVVNDGSRDDTGRHIDDAAAAAPERVRAIHLAKNSGKRHAVYAGLKAAESELVATVDSDSRVPPSSLANLVAPLVQRGRVAGVAGKVIAWNRDHNLLTRMLGVRYILGFDFIRAYQSRLGTVWCCPGALQAYRLDVIAPHLEAWRDQRFLGARCTNGDDHALTNMVLSLGHDTVYQSTAVVETMVPESYGALCRMYIRWGRSATREGLRALRFAPRRAWSKGPLRGPLILFDALMQPLTILAKLVGFFATLYVALLHPLWFVKVALGTTVLAVLYSLVFLRSERSTEVLFGILYAWYSLFLLIWVQPFATVTVRGNRWLTRG